MNAAHRHLLVLYLREVVMSEIDKDLPWAADPFSYGELIVEDIDWAVNPYLSDEVKESLKTKVMQTCEPGCYIVRYFGFKALAKDVPENAKKLAKINAKKLAKIINEVCSTYKVIGSLSTAIKLDLFCRTEEQQALYVKYVAFSWQASKVIDSLMDAKIPSPFFREGEMPKDG